jgi:hypothetical protein
MMTKDEDARPSRILRLRQAPLVIAWRWFTGKELDSQARTDAGWFRPGTRALDPGEVPPP